MPGIFWSILALLWAVPVPGWMAELAWFNVSTLALFVIIGFYGRLSLPLTAGVVALTLACQLSAYALEQWLGVTGLLTVAVSVFVVLWIGQFLGHRIEGKRPSFFKDIQFLMIGPAWVMAFLFRKVGLPY